ncbi:hypothetical protein [Nostoc sp. DedQUE09]|uniref:hypothetical protein n=1 Tax=Nostoc sp. DedQUE09 TaxID=3075394 RepID=UPI002AD20A3A|nr:hypothetical protein [Nostoc sp. DedQUE09]MDZ7955392.1 hypothetical protein [Nostoc sp. DedQUE09]
MNYNFDRELDKDEISTKQPKQFDMTNVVPGLEELGRQLLASYKSSSNEFRTSIRGLLQKIPLEPEIVPIMRYEKAISYFVVNRPPDPKIVKGAMLKYYHLKGNMFIQVFLDSDNQLVCQPDDTPYGRQVLVEKFDDELAETFGDQDLVIVE